MRIFKRLTLILSVFLNSAALAASCPEQLQQQINSLSETVRKHEYLYHVKGQPEISDAEFDALQERLRHLQNCLGQNTDDVLTLPSGIHSQAHAAYMGSLRKAETQQEIEAFIKKIRQADDQVLLQPKIDGIALELVYLDGHLQAASTRGNGESGENVLARILSIPAIPSQIENQTGRLVLHGEFFLRLDKAVSASSDYASARHHAAALLMKTQVSKTQLALLDFFPWHWVNSPNSTRMADYQQLEKMGFHWPLKYSQLIADTEQAVIGRHGYYNNKELPFLLDGIVLKANKHSTVQQLPGTSERPGWAIAWKFPPQEQVTEVKNITYRIGRSGRAAFVLEVKPVLFGGAEVSRVAVGGVKALTERNVAPGDHISVAFKGSANPVFLKVLWRTPQRKPYVVPELDQYDAFSCMTLSAGCKQQFLARLLWIVQQLKISSLGEATLERLMDAGHLKKLYDLFETDWIKLSKNTGINTDDVRRWSAQLASARHQPFAKRILVAGIPGIGVVKAQKLADEFAGWDDLGKATSDDLVKAGLNHQTATDLQKWFSSAEIIRLLRYL